MKKYKIAVYRWKSTDYYNYESSESIIRDSITPWVEITEEELKVLEKAQKEGLKIDGWYWSIIHFVEEQKVKETVKDYIQYFKDVEKEKLEAKRKREERKKKKALEEAKAKEEEELATLHMLKQKYSSVLDDLED